jgi:hypothetical protein
MVEFNITNEEGSGFPQDETVAVFSNTEITPLVSLRNRREEIVSNLFIDIKVPRWEDPEIFVRFKPVSATRLNSAIEKRRKQKSDDWSLLANADMLVDSCVGIYGVIDGDKDNKLSLRIGDPNGSLTKFDPELGAALGVDAQRAVDVCTSLYLTEGDLLEVANRLFQWSGVASDEADETF